MGEKIEKINKIIDLSSIVLLYSLIFLVPLYFRFYVFDFSGMPYNFALEKTMIFRLLVDILLVLLILKIFITSRLASFDRKLFLAIMPFFLALIFVTIFSVDPEKSFFGSYLRQQGLLTHLHFLAFIILLALNLSNRKQWNHLVFAGVLSGTLVAIIGMVEWFGYDVFFWSREINPGGRVGSTMGQPVFLGNFLLLSITLGFYGLTIFNKRLPKYLVVFSLACQLLCLIFTYTRGAWIGLIGGFLLWFAIKFYQRRGFKKLIILAISLLVVFLLFISFFQDDIKNNLWQNRRIPLNIVNRLESFFDLSIGSVGLRLMIWQSAIAPIAEKPLFGYGPENQRDVFIKQYQSEWSLFENLGVYPDRAHNEYLDLLLIGGVATFGAFFWLLYFLFSFCFRNFVFSSSNHDRGPIILLSGLSAYLISLGFSFSLTETWLYFWLIVVLVFVIDRKEKIVNLNSFRPAYKALLYFILFFIFCYASYFVYFNIQGLRADRAFRQTKISPDSGKFVEYLKNYSQALAINPYEQEYRNSYVLDLIRAIPLINDSEERRQIVEALIYLLELEEKGAPDYFSLMRQAGILAALGKYSDKNYYLQAEKKYFEIINNYPVAPNTYYDWGNMYFLAKDYQKAIIVYQRAIKATPDLNDRRMNDTHRSIVLGYLSQIHNQIAEASFSLKNYQEAIKYYLNVLKIDPYNLTVYEKMAQCHLALNNPVNAENAYLRAQRLDRDNYWWPLQLALLYQRTGQTELSRQNKQSALKLNPPVEAVKLLDNINK